MRPQPVSAIPSPAPPQRIGPYRVLRPCPTRGGDEVAFVVWDTVGQRHAVLQSSGDLDAQRRAARTEQIRADVAITTRLRHPGVIQFYGFGEDEAAGPYLVREFVRGPSLRSLPTADLDLHAALAIVIQASHALTAADAAGVAPRAVRLEHLFVTRSGQVKVSLLGRPHLPPATRGTRTADVARAALELLTGQDSFPREPRIPAILDAGLKGAFERVLGPPERRVHLDLMQFVRVLVAEAPLGPDLRSELLELSDLSAPIVEDQSVAAWARSVWRHDVPYLTVVSEDGEGEPEVLYAEPVPAPDDAVEIVVLEPEAAAPRIAGAIAAPPRPARSPPRGPRRAIARAAVVAAALATGVGAGYALAHPARPDAPRAATAAAPACAAAPRAVETAQRAAAPLESEPAADAGAQAPRG